jgi:hypothetical protein
VIIELLLLGRALLAVGDMPKLPDCPPNALPRFEDYPAKQEEVVDRKLDLASNPIGPRFRTRLRQAVREEPLNLAGDFLLTGWGCGTGCQQFVVINPRSGRIWHDPDLILTRGTDSRVSSELVILNPGPDPTPFGAATLFMRWHDGRLDGICQHLQKAPLDAPDGSPNPSLQRTLPGRSPGRCR